MDLFHKQMHRVFFPFYANTGREKILCALVFARGIPSMRWFLQGKGHKKVRILLLSLLLKKYEEDFNKPFFVLRIQT